MKHKILLVEDEMSLGHLIRERIQAHGYDVVWATDGERAFLEFENFKPDLCLLDVMVPKKDGFSLAKDIRKIDKQVPIIFLTAKSLPESLKKGFMVGADDYVTKPFRMEELLLRIQAVLKRTFAHQILEQQKENYQIGIFNLKVTEQTLSTSESTKELSHKEAMLLELLFLHKNAILPRENALSKIWGQNSFSASRSMDVYILKLRNHLSKDPSIKILNIWGKGFKLVIP